MTTFKERRTATSVLVIGTGAAGLRAAIELAERGVQVLCIGKRRRDDAHTVLASGGINAALGTRDPEDSWEQHFADTVREGYFLGDPRLVEIMARESPDAVLELAAWGCEFARTDDGELDQRFFGAHRWRRTCYAGDFTGRAIMRTVAAKAAELGIRVEEDQYVSRLLVADGTCFGALAFDLHTGERTVHLADAVILATGGHTRIWRRSSSRRDENYGDGMRMALDAGCRLMDMELVQFHPTGMVFPEEAAGTLVTEAVRGEGGRLYNAVGERYMERYDPVRLELSSRDRVALANYTEIVQGRGGPHGGVFLDITHRGKDYICEKLPRMYRQFVEWQMLDISREPMEVAPTAHYTMGGIVVDPETHATDVPGLYAAGECVGGLHGANRLGGNALMETITFGRRAGAHAAEWALANTTVEVPPSVEADSERELKELLSREDGERPWRIRDELATTMHENFGVFRREELMRKQGQIVEGLQERYERVVVDDKGELFNNDVTQALELGFLLELADCMIVSGLARKESRGAHARPYDFPDRDDENYMRHTVVTMPGGRPRLDWRPVTVTKWQPQERTY